LGNLIIKNFMCKYNNISGEKNLYRIIMAYQITDPVTKIFGDIFNFR